MEVSAASTIVVNGTCTTGDFYCDTIQEAIEMAKDGDTIVVCQGIYGENIKEGKSVSIRSYAGSSNTVIQTYEMSKVSFIVTAQLYISTKAWCIKEGERMVAKERYVVDKEGERIGVLLDLNGYRKILKELEELESIRAYDKAKTSGDEAIPFDKAIEEIDR